jgi:hypothetical protein
MDVILDERGVDPAAYEAARKRAQAKAEFMMSGHISTC